MSTHTLTTDLIADCMALIPQNLERLNESQTFYVCEIISSKIYFTVNKNTVYTPIFNVFHEKEDKIKTSWYYHIISHCLETIPEFQAETKEYKETEQKLNVAIKDLHDKQYSDEYRYIAYGEAKNLQGQMEWMPKTIKQATLFGNGTFPSTLSQLCESYKNVMSK